MNRPLLSTFVLVTVSLAASASVPNSASADELFSRVSTGSVFSESNSSQHNDNQRAAFDPGRRLTSASQLADVLRDAGLEPKTEHERIATIEIQQGQWTFPVSLGINEAGDQIRLALTLYSFQSGSKPTSEQLLSLLSANREHQPAFFSYSEKRNQLELFVSLDNEAITPRRLREEIRRAATIAEATAELWRPASTTTSASAGAAKTAKPTAVAATPAAGSNPVATTEAARLIGKWSAARSSTQAFAMQFNRDGTFALVSVIDGKQSKANGKFSLNNSQLVLTTDAGSSSATLRNVTDSSFEFSPAGKDSAKLTFKRAR